MMIKKIGTIALVSLFLTLPAFAMTYKTNYSIPCSQVWVAVKDTLSVPDNYTVVSTDDAQMTSSYDVKHSAHVNISGTVLQRTNKVTLVTKGTGCEMQVVSNYSGWEHNDKGDFKKRVDESLAKLNASKPAEPVKPPDAK
jgi:exopolysaccharide biosynthesis protein